MRSDLSALRVLIVLAFAAISFSFGRSSAAAQTDDAIHINPARLYGGMWLGFDSNKSPDHPANIVGGQFGLDVVGLQEWFSLGMETRIGAAKWKTGCNTKVIDFDLKPRLRMRPKDVPLEFYLTAPIGVTVPRLSDSGKDSSANLGWNVGAGGGLNLFFSDNFGINVEPMFLRHSFSGAAPGGGDLVVKQFALFLNVIIAPGEHTLQ